jgi:hypothetical protein
MGLCGWMLQELRHASWATLLSTSPNGGGKFCGVGSRRWKISAPQGRARRNDTPFWDFSRARRVLPSVAKGSLIGAA